MQQKDCKIIKLSPSRSHLILILPVYFHVYKRLSYAYCCLCENTFVWLLYSSITWHFLLCLFCSTSNTKTYKIIDNDHVSSRINLALIRFYGERWRGLLCFSVFCYLSFAVHLNTRFCSMGITRFLTWDTNCDCKNTQAVWSYMDLFH